MTNVRATPRARAVTVKSDPTRTVSGKLGKAVRLHELESANQRLPAAPVKQFAPALEQSKAEVACEEHSRSDVAVGARSS
jgi:hypothetical protein